MMFDWWIDDASGSRGGTSCNLRHYGPGIRPGQRQGVSMSEYTDQRNAGLTEGFDPATYVNRTDQERIAQLRRLHTIAETLRADSVERSGIVGNVMAQYQDGRATALEAAINILGGTL